MKVIATMIVKNEAHVISRCLESVLPLVDGVLIADTGSTDNTHGAVMESCAGKVPVHYFRPPWVNFGHNRTEAFRLAEESFQLTAADWHLVIDADDAIEFPKPPDVRFNLCVGKADCWELEVEHHPSRYYRLHFFRADGSWRYVGPAHEYPSRGEGKEANKGTFSPEVIRYRFLGGGATYLVPQAEKFAGHAELFRETLAANPEDTRSAFYLAQSLKDAGQVDAAIDAYQRRAKMGGWAQEAYYSLLQAGRLLLHRGNSPKDSYREAHQLDHTRAEAPFEIAKYLGEMAERPAYGPHRERLLEEAYLWAEVAATRPEPTKDHLFVEPDVWMWSRNLAAQLRARLFGELVDCRNADRNP